MSESSAPSTSGSPITSSQYLAQQATEGLPSNQAPANSTPPTDDENFGMDMATPDDLNSDDALTLPNSEPQKSRIAPGLYRPMPEMTVLEWTAPSRPFKKRTKRFFTTIVVIGLLVSLILFFAGQVLPVAVVFSIIFLVYVFSVVPPTTVNHKITTFGIHMEGDLYHWEELGRFWFETKLNNPPLLHIEIARFPNRVTLLLGNQTEDVMREVLSEVLLEERPPLTQFEKVAQWLEQRIPLDIE